jgi:hypothetical protein
MFRYPPEKVIALNTLKSDPRKPVAKKASKPIKNHKLRPVPYARVEKMWAAGRSIREIAKSIRRTGKGDDPYHAMRVILSLMHRGYRNATGKRVKLPYRVSKSSVRLSRKAGKKAVA